MDCMEIAASWFCRVGLSLLVIPVLLKLLHLELGRCSLQMICGLCRWPTTLTNLVCVPSSRPPHFLLKLLGMIGNYLVHAPFVGCAACWSLRTLLLRGIINGGLTLYGFLVQMKEWTSTERYATVWRQHFCSISSTLRRFLALRCWVSQCMQQRSQLLKERRKAREESSNGRGKGDGGRGPNRNKNDRKDKKDG